VVCGGCAGDCEAETDGDDEAWGEHASVDRSNEIAEEWIEHEEKHCRDLMLGKTQSRAASVSACETGKPGGTQAYSAMRAKTRENVDRKGNRKEGDNGKENDFDHARVGVADLVERDFVPGMRSEVGDGCLNKSAEGQQWSGSKREGNPYAGAECA
jgi:hypothetical protein